MVRESLVDEKRQAFDDEIAKRVASSAPLEAVVGKPQKYTDVSAMLEAVGLEQYISGFVRESMTPRVSGR